MENGLVDVLVARLTEAVLSRLLDAKPVTPAPASHPAANVATHPAANMPRGGEPRESARRPDDPAFLESIAYVNDPTKARKGWRSANDPALALALGDKRAGWFTSHRTGECAVTGKRIDAWSWRTKVANVYVSIASRDTLLRGLPTVYGVLASKANGGAPAAPAQAIGDVRIRRRSGKV